MWDHCLVVAEQNIRFLKFCTNAKRNLRDFIILEIRNQQILRTDRFAKSLVIMLFLKLFKKNKPWIIDNCLI